MIRKLLQHERENLIKRHRAEKNARVRDRIKAVLAYDDGYSFFQIAQILLLDDDTIRKHINDYFSNNKLKPENGGSKSNLNNDQTNKLISHLEEHIYLYVKDICAYAQKTFNITYTISGMTKWLHHNNFCYKKPHGNPAKADKQKQKEFIKKYKELKSSINPDEIILFADSTHPQHQTKLNFGWIKKGIRKSVKMTACQKRINLIGAINLENHKIDYKKVDWVNTESLKDFATQLCTAYPDATKIHLILDNAGYHKSEKFLNFIKTTKIKIHYLPPYSPNLNPIERLWKIMHEKVTYNKYYEKFANFTEGILNFFKNIDQYKNIIINRINDNFQRLEFT